MPCGVFFMPKGRQDMNKLNNKKVIKFSTSYVAKLAILTAFSFLLYAFCKFPLPFLFPEFLDIQFSELPALLAGFSMGPLSGCLVIILKCVIKMPMSSTAFVGEFTDIIIGIAFVLPASVIYRIKKDKKHAIMGLAVGTIFVVIFSVLANRFISIPFYVAFLFGGNWSVLLNMCAALYPNITVSNFYIYYLLLAIVPFNILRCVITSVLTFLIYKRISKVLHWEGSKITHAHIDNIKNCTFISKSIADTYYLAKKLANELNGGEVITLEGDLGAGKTTFTKGLAIALGIAGDSVTSPTFTIMKEYIGKLKLYHFDMYRIEKADELAELGIDEVINEKDGVSVIEWNKFDNLSNVIKIKIERVNETTRKFTIGE
jgi:tRNA threonylcarbamoyl adenosine modification protein YjeE